MYENEIEEIANYYGLENQTRQLIEEMAELTVAMNKYHRLHNETCKEIQDRLKEEILLMNIAEEIADVQIMLEQVKFLLGMTCGDIEFIQKKKIKRQLERMEKE